MRPSPIEPTRFQVFGERSSGTNFVKRLIGKNTHLKPSEDLGWKHGFPHMVAVPHDMLIICAVRNAADWVRSMHSKPWHTPPEMQKMEFSDFIRAPWATIADRPRYFPQLEKFGGTGQPLQMDRHPITGQVFPNIFALRQAKLNALLGFLSRDCGVIFVRLEAVQTDPQSFLSALSANTGTGPLKGSYAPVTKRLGSRFKPSVNDRPETPKSLSESDFNFMQQEIDLESENSLGLI